MLTHPAQDRRIRPWRLRHEVQQRLVLGRRALRRRYRCQWLHALAAFRREQTDAIERERLDTVSVTERRCKVRHIGSEPCFRVTSFVAIHLTLP